MFSPLYTRTSEFLKVGETAMKALINILLTTVLGVIGTLTLLSTLNTVFADQSVEGNTFSSVPKVISATTDIELSLPEPPSPEKTENPEKDEKKKPKIGGLHPEVEKKSEKLVEKAEDKDIDIRITSGFRTEQLQDALYAQGRTTPGSIVTNAKGGESYHNYGLAVDFVIEDGNDLIWDLEYDGNDNDKSDWKEVAEIAKDLGFEWGGDWDDFVDYPHLQMDFDTSIEDLQNGDDDIFR